MPGDEVGQACVAVAAARTDHQPTRTGLTWLVDHPFGFGQDLVHDRVMDRAVADDHRHPVTRRRLERPLRNWMQATFRADYFRRLCGQIGRASCWERVCPYGWVSVVAGLLKKKNIRE